MADHGFAVGPRNDDPGFWRVVGNQFPAHATR